MIQKQEVRKISEGDVCVTGAVEQDLNGEQKKSLFQIKPKGSCPQKFNQDQTGRLIIIKTETHLDQDADKGEN